MCNRFKENPLLLHIRMKFNFRKDVKFTAAWSSFFHFVMACEALYFVLHWLFGWKSKSCLTARCFSQAVRQETRKRDRSATSGLIRWQNYSIKKSSAILVLEHRYEVLDIKSCLSPMIWHWQVAVMETRSITLSADRGQVAQLKLLTFKSSDCRFVRLWPRFSWEIQVQIQQPSIPLNPFQTAKTSLVNIFLVPNIANVLLGWTKRFGVSCIGATNKLNAHTAVPSLLSETTSDKADEFLNVYQPP